MEPAASVLPVRWAVYEDYRLEDGVIMGIGEPRTVELMDLIEQTDERVFAPDSDDRQRAFTRFANIRTEEDILTFARRYGLLGMFGHCFPVPVWESDESEQNLVGFLNRQGYLSPVATILEELNTKLSPAVSPEKPLTREGIENGLRGRKLNQTLIAAESVTDWLRVVEDFRAFLETPPQHEQAGMETLFHISKQASLQFGLAGVRLSVSRDDQWRLRWQVASLLDALWLQAAQNLAGTSSVESCERCGSLFVAEYQYPVRYCSDRCRIATQNARAYRRRKARRLHSEGHSIQEIAADMKASEEDVSEWVGENKEE